MKNQGMEELILSGMNEFVAGKFLSGNIIREYLILKCDLQFNK